MAAAGYELAYITDTHDVLTAETSRPARRPPLAIRTALVKQPRARRDDAGRGRVAG